MTNRMQGLEDIVAAQSAVTSIDGRAGELRYRGYPIGELAERCTFEEVVYLLWEGELPSSDQLAEFKRELRSERVRCVDLVERVENVPLSAHPLDVLRYVLSWDALGNPLTASNDAVANRQKGTAFLAWFPVVVAAYHRLRAGLAPIRPRPDLDTASNLLYMLHGEEPASVSARTLDTSLVLHADHELNASTFAARVTIATQSNLHAAVASALGTLVGPRHGGASDRVIHMLEEIGTPERAESWTMEQLARRERVMGFGHRVYRTVDPRSRHLRAMADQKLAGTPHAAWIEILDRVGVVMEREKSLYPNVDLYAALVNHELGFDPAFYTSIFACSRVAGWIAHSIEQLSGRMIRPVAEYVGPEPRSLAALAGS